MTWLETLPLMGIALVILVALRAAATIGYRGHLRLLQRRGETSSESHDHLLSAVLGLLALLLGFTFSLALNRYEARRDLVVQEANAIDTTWLRAQLLQPPDKAAMSDLLRAYLDSRLAWSEAGAAADMAPTTRLQQKLWAVTGPVMRSDPNAQLSRAVMDTMHDSFDLAEGRAATRL